MCVLYSVVPRPTISRMKHFRDDDKANFSDDFDVELFFLDTGARPWDDGTPPVHRTYIFVDTRLDTSVCLNKYILRIYCVSGVYRRLYNTEPHYTRIMDRIIIIIIIIVITSCYVRTRPSDRYSNDCISI